MSLTMAQPILGRAAWRGDELAASTDWIRILTTPELNELDAALRSVQGRGLAWRDMTQQDFPIPRLAA